MKASEMAGGEGGGRGGRDSLLTLKKAIAKPAAPSISWNCAQVTRVHPRKKLEPDAASPGT